MASRNKDERANVNALIKAIQKNSPRVYVHIDRDAGSIRHTSSGWDFLLAFNGRVVFCEAKLADGKLTTWQQFTQAFISSAVCDYFVIRFTDDGKCFSVDDGELIAIEDAQLKNFIEL